MPRKRGTENRVDRYDLRAGEARPRPGGCPVDEQTLSSSMRSGRKPTQMDSLMS